MRYKISVLGSGNVGSEVVFWCAVKELGDIILWNRTKETAIGKALDIMESAPIAKFDARIKGTGDLNEIKDSDIVVITSGVARKPGMTREELTAINAKIVVPLVKNVIKHAKNSILIIVTNPLDPMTYAALKASRFKRNKVFGIGGALDSSRFRYFIAKELNVSIEGINGLVIGSHGENMIPIPRLANVSGIPITDLISKEKIKKLVKHTKEAGGEIIKLLNANVSYSIGAAVAESIESILKDKKRIISSSVYLKGEYNIRDCCIGIPVVLGRNGIEKIIELKLNLKEKQELNNAYKNIKSLIKTIR